MIDPNLASTNDDNKNIWLLYMLSSDHISCLYIDKCIYLN